MARRHDDVQKLKDVIKACSNIQGELPAGYVALSVTLDRVKDQARFDLANLLVDIELNG